MKINWSYIKVLVLLGLVGFLYAFTNQRNSSRVVNVSTVKFKGEDNLFLTQDDVSKLLIQNPEGLNNGRKDIIDLNKLEYDLNSNPMVKDAEVYMSINGEITAEVEQKRPIARVYTNVSYYVDDQGSYMPLSANYSARVPLVTGNVLKSKLNSIYKIAKKIDEDAFLKQHVIEIHQDKRGGISLRLRTFDFDLQLGDLKNLDRKVNNFKAFYKKTIKDKTINTYKSVNLRFDSQVICTKK